MTRLVIFDVDETLLSSRDDTACFVRAFEHVLGLTGFPVGMQHYHHTTDAGIAGEIIAAAYARPATPHELRAIRDRYAVLLEGQTRQAPGSIRQVPGAAQALAWLRADPGSHVALATGAWEPLAALKLRVAGLAVDGVPRATCDDSLSRAEIVRLAIARARQHYGRERFEHVVLVGDGTWDLETARVLGIEFIGVGAHLRDRGARWVFDDLQDLRGLAAALESFTQTTPEHYR